ncbi:hypothetical protein F5Y15DRAFT_101001 [Xylariaceae sp. FL0016]|nr:hypothetical protein F5Y15DRAFT_101001 [Xylariaceae sp. FL0016]
MLSNEDSGDPFAAPPSNGDNDSSPSHNRPWPYFDTFSQARFERKYFQEGATLDFDRLPKLQSWAPFFGLHDGHRTVTVLRRIMASSEGGQRPLSAPEIEALAENAVNSLRTFAWTQPVSTTLAIAMARSSAATFKFPFYQPKMKSFNPYIFPAKSMPLLKGPRASMAWHSVRFMAYAPLCWIATALCFSSQADTAFKYRLTKDPRLSRLVNDMQEKSKNIWDAQRRPHQRDRNGHSDGQQPSQPVGLVSQKDGNEGDYSFAPDNFEQPAPDSDTTSAARSSFWSRSGPSQASPSKSPGTASPMPQPKSSDATDDTNLFEQDDASPISHSTRRAEASQAQSGSAWDRVRQQSRSEVAKWRQGDTSGQEHSWAKLRQDKAPNTTETYAKGDEYSYSTQDEERGKKNYDKEQAQKEFDALLEAERRGQSNDSNWRKPR